MRGYERYDAGERLGREKSRVGMKEVGRKKERRIGRKRI
jgi:hypothetical protein